MSGSAALLPEEKARAFREATSGFAKRYANQISKGMGDAELKQALTDYLGIFGGYCSPNTLSVAYKGSGLKIWASWDIPNHCTDTPVFEGKATVAMARYIYNIADPSKNQQLSLL